MHNNLPKGPPGLNNTTPMSDAASRAGRAATKTASLNTRIWGTNATAYKPKLLDKQLLLFSLVLFCLC